MNTSMDFGRSTSAWVNDGKSPRHKRTAKRGLNNNLNRVLICRAFQLLDCTVLSIVPYSQSYPRAVGHWRHPCRTDAGKPIPDSSRFDSWKNRTLTSTERVILEMVIEAMLQPDPTRAKQNTKLNKVRDSFDKPVLERRVQAKRMIALGTLQPPRAAPCE